MDHYRLLSAHSGGCRGAEHVLQILECASPSIDKEKDDLFAAVEERGERMFFSQRKLEEYFRGTHDSILNEVLDCDCELCLTQCREPLERLRCKNRSKETKAWILVPVMIYLGKFHLVYPWLRAITRDHITREGTIRKIDCEDVEAFRSANSSNPLFHSRMESNLFKFAYNRVWCMFHPVRFVIDTTGLVERQDLPDWARFPYQNENKVRLPQGQSSTVTYAEIPDEYVDASVEHRMRAYPESIKRGDPIEPKAYCIVRKAVKLSDDRSEGMQHEVHSLLAVRKEEEGAENIITLLGLYTWRGSIHYVFPFVEQNLADLLSQGYRRDARDGILQIPLSLPDIWLWREVTGVAKALQYIHQGIPNPFPGDSGKVFAFHFDLKPENILVKWDTDPGKRRLQITDFGRSQIRLLDEGDDQSSSLYLGDHKYMAPEAWWGTGKDSADEPLRVLQTYDVWSLACIMLEVLIYLGAEHQKQGSGPEAMKRFNKAREMEDPRVQFFARHGTKFIVADKVRHIRSWLAVPESVVNAPSVYINRLKVILTQMFTFSMTNRPASAKVVRALEDARGEYYRDPIVETAILQQKIRGMFQDEERGFKEVGWYNGKSLVSFLTMENIQVHASVTSDGGDPFGSRDDHYKNCRIQLLYMQEGTGHAGKFLMKWGLKHDQTEQIEMLPIMDATRTRIIPHYRCQLENSDSHYCILVILPQRDASHQWQVRIGFGKYAEAQAFQGALLHYKIIPGSKMYVPEAEWTMWQKKKILSSQKDMVHQDDHVNFEFWEKEGPNYYNSHFPSAPSPLQPYKIIAIFRKGMPLLLLPVNTNDKRFKEIGQGIIEVLYNKGDNFKKFLLHWVNKQCRACQGGNKFFCSCGNTPWDDRSTFSKSDEPAIPLEMTLLNLSRFLNSSRIDDIDPSGRLQGLIKTHELLNAQFILAPENMRQDVECFKRAAGRNWK